MPKTKAKEPIRLLFWGAEPGSPQAKFERICVDQLKLNAGIFAIKCEDGPLGMSTNYGYMYIHRQVQWMWKQYQKGIAE